MDGRVRNTFLRLAMCQAQGYVLWSIISFASLRNPMRSLRPYCPSLPLSLFSIYLRQGKWLASWQSSAERGWRAGLNRRPQPPPSALCLAAPQAPDALGTASLQPRSLATSPDADIAPAPHPVSLVEIPQDTLVGGNILTEAWALPRARLARGLTNEKGESSVQRF